MKDFMEFFVNLLLVEVLENLVVLLRPAIKEFVFLHLQILEECVLPMVECLCNLLIIRSKSFVVLLISLLVIVIVMDLLKIVI